jgi:hypothetical protein
MHKIGKLFVKLADGVVKDLKLLIGDALGPQILSRLSLLLIARGYG